MLTICEYMENNMLWSNSLTRHKSEQYNRQISAVNTYKDYEYVEIATYHIATTLSASANQLCESM